MKLQKNLLQIVGQEQTEFVYGKGKRKPEIQQLYEELEACGERLMGYKECFEIMGRDRNSYSKTDLEATFFFRKGSSQVTAFIQNQKYTVSVYLKFTVD